MNTQQTILFISVLVIGLFALYKARRYTNRMNAKHESEASDRIKKDLALARSHIREYNVYRHHPAIFGKKDYWGESDINTFKQEVHWSMYFRGMAGPARYSIKIDEETKTIYYSIGSSDFDFSNLRLDT